MTIDASGLASYPYGYPASLSEATTRYLSMAGVRYAFTTLANRVSESSPPLLLGRATMFEGTGFHYIRGTAGQAESQSTESNRVYLSELPRTSVGLHRRVE